jgi:hypothetical protein
MKQILENLELPEETKVELQESFDAAVSAEVKTLVESKEEAYEEYMLAQMTEMKTELEDTLDAYLEKVVEQFVEDNTFAIEESVKTEKYEAILEGFNSLMIASGVEIAQIAEAKEAEEAEVDESATEIADRLMAENMELKEKNAELLKTGLVKESMEDMTVLEKEKFLKLAKVVEFKQENPVDFIEKMDTLVESVKATKIEKVEEKVIVESVEAGKYTSSASHLF